MSPEERRRLFFSTLDIIPLTLQHCRLFPSQARMRNILAQHC